MIFFEKKFNFNINHSKTKRFTQNIRSSKYSNYFFL